MTTKRSLGRGLSELLSNTHVPSLMQQSLAEDKPHSLPIEWLQPGKYQPRKEMHPDALQELAESIRAQGILQPLLVRRLGNQQYEIIAGERRWRAAQLAQLEKVPVFVREISDQAAIAMGLIENIQREDLNAMDQAIALQRLGNEFNLTHEEIAHAVGKSRATVSNLLRLLHLELPVKKFLENGDLDMGHARALLALSGAQQSSVAQHVVSKNLSVRETETLVQRNLAPSVKKAPQKVDRDIMKFQSELSDKLGAMVKIQHTVKGKGKLVIHYHSLEELDGILERF